MREDFENGQIARMQWIIEKVKLVDALTKRNLEIFRRRNEVMAIRALEPYIFEKAKRIQFN